MNFPGFRADWELFAQISSLALVFSFLEITDHSQLRVNRSLSCGRVSIGHAAASLMQCMLGELIKYLCLSQSSNRSAYTGGMTQWPLCPLSEKSARRWTDLADIRGDRKSLMKVNNPSGPEDEEKPGPPEEQLKWWTYGM